MGENGGIYSLAGFAYQMKVFILQVLHLNSGCTLEYETIDDVALKMSASNIDEHEDELCSILATTSKKAVQVKKTQVTNSVIKKVVKNWILADKNNDGIEQFVLVTNRAVSADILANLNVAEMCKEVQSAAGNKSIEAKIKLIGYSEENLKQKIQDIVSKANIQIYEDIDKKIENEFSDFFIKSGVSDATYFARIKEFLQHLTVDILDAVGKGQPYRLTYENLI